MHNLTLQNQTMSSLEISELTGKRHDNVSRDIKKMLQELSLDILKFEEVTKNQKNQLINKESNS